MSESEQPDQPTPKGGQEDVLNTDKECISVDAGAGSGKTTTMRWRIEQMLTADDAPPSDRMLVLTFANEAASSIQESITDAEQLSIDQAYNIDIYTYHSFCNRLISEYAYVLGIDPDFEVITQDQRLRIIRSLIEENDYQYVSRRQANTETVVKQAKNYIWDMRQEAITPDDVDEYLPEELAIKNLKRLTVDLERTVQFFDTDEHNLVDDNYDVDYPTLFAHIEEYQDALTRWRRVAQNQSADIWDTIDTYLSYMEQLTDMVEALLRNDSDAALGFLPQALFYNDVHKGWWPDIYQTPFGHLKSYIEALEEIYELQKIYHDYVDELDSRGALDFDELIYKADTLINDTQIGDEIRSRWDYVFCDEFQDTDDIQMDVVTGLCRDDAQLLAIGDVDQAIYGWRGANPEGLNDLGDNFAESEQLDIKRNFRSDQEILELANQCAAYDSKRLISDDCDAETPDGDPIVERDEGDQARLGLVNGEWTQQSTAEEVATTISQLLEDGFDDIEERSLADIAVIVRKNEQARKVAASLRSRQIPYRIDGSSESEMEPGVQTILSYFRVLVDSEADMHLRRVLMLVYRVSEDDLKALETAPVDSLYEAVINHDDIGSLSLIDPDRVTKAQTDLNDLRELKDSHSLSYFYNAFLNKTRIQWYLQKEDRAQLDRIKKFMQAYESDNVLRRFSEGFVDSLAESLSGRDDDLSIGIASQSNNKVNILTVHQAKGLQFDTVLFPYLEDDEWVSNKNAVWGAHRFDSIIRDIKEDVFTHPLVESVYQEELKEQWRTIHVGVTRAESLLVLFSQPPEEIADYKTMVSDLREKSDQASLAHESPGELLEATFPDVDTRWSLEQPQMQLWDAITDAFKEVEDRYPETVVNLSDDVKQAANVTPGTITYYNRYEDELNLEQAIDEIHELGQDIFEENLTPQDPTAHDIYPSSLLFEDGAELLVQHSHTSLETYSDCPRRHLLDHVLYGFDDPMPADAAVGGSDEPSWRKVGDVFHAVAEEAFYRNDTAEDEWLAICDRIVRARDLESVRDAVKACIHRLFATDLLEWEPVAAELPFEVTGVPGVDGPIVGYMDSVRQVPDKGLAVLDYKSTFEKRDIASSSQLLLYLRACEGLFDEPVDWAGYVYVGEAGGTDGKIDLIHRDELEGSWNDVVDMLQAADSPSWEAEPGSHCRHCPHRSLGCAPDEHAYDNEYVIESVDSTPHKTS
ncbi:ATP-dependent helicase [Halococcus agarilyticus]|uniref:ATP-dependent helicase n=1 Tax=Halococcus agarilyticus TaxID=1232219 RepID=UPI0009ADE0CD|nr:ATP-dependent DNA helicase [Halococcus agarilyticus]